MGPNGTPRGKAGYKNDFWREWRDLFSLFRSRAHRNESQSIFTLILKLFIEFLLELVNLRNVPGMGLGDARLGKGIQAGVISG
jgi:hypothetical protein